jgi:hypothetical protein
MGAVQWSDNAARNLEWNFGVLRARQGRPSRPAFSGFDVPATGQDGRPFHRYVPICRPFAGFCPLSGLFLGRFQRPNTAPPSAAAGPLAGRMPHGCAARRRREPGAAFDPRPCRFLNATGTDAPPPRADTIFQTSAISGPKLAFGPCRADPPSYMRLTVAISRVIDRWGFG